LQGDLSARKDYEEVKATDEKLGDARYLQGIYMAWPISQSKKQFLMRRRMRVTLAGV
jgi:hypothetical protein